MPRRKKPHIIKNKPKDRIIDYNNMLPDGTASTYLAIFDGQNNPIFDTQKQLPLGLFVTGFNYEDDEDDDDSGDITIETDNVNIISLPQLGYLMPIKLQWGWIYPDNTYKSSPIRSVVVKKHKVDFTPEGVKLTLEVASASFLLKNQSAHYENNKEGDFIKYIKGLLQGVSVPVSVCDYSVKPYAEITSIKKVR